MSKRRGFTLIEVLVVVAIIALLISILIPSLSEARRVSKKTVCLHNLHDIGIAAHAYLTTNQDTFPYIARFPSTEVSVAMTVGRDPYVPIPVALRRETGGNGQGADAYKQPNYDAALLKETSSNGQIFQCPADVITKPNILAMPNVVARGPRYFDSQKTSYEWETQLNGVKLQYKKLKVIKGLLSPLLKDVWMMYDYEPFHGGPLRRGSHNVLYADLAVHSDNAP